MTNPDETNPDEVATGNPAPAVRLSVVIPAYNEADTIGTTLEHLAAQTRPVDEVVIADNNSTDDTVAVARSFADCLPVRVVPVSRQGVAWAREAGFDASTGELIGRIDADTRVEPEWSARLVEFFTERPDVGAAGGFDMLYDIPFEKGMQSRARQAAAAMPEGREAATLAGNNMALRRTAWEAARSHLRNAPDTHEDIDLYYALLEAGEKAWLVPGMAASVSPRRFRYSPWANRHYRAAAINTARVHGRDAEARKLTAQGPLMYSGLTFWWLLVRPFEPADRSWRPWRLFGGSDDRVQPMTD